MPIYQYLCLDCKRSFNAFHSMDKEYEGTCGFCESENVEKVISDISGIVNEDRFETKAGDLVKSHIEEAKQDVRKQKKEMKRGFE